MAHTLVRNQLQGAGTRVYADVQRALEDLQQRLPCQLSSPAMEDRQIQLITMMFRIDEFLEVRRSGEQGGRNLFFQGNRF